MGEKQSFSERLITFFSGGRNRGNFNFIELIKLIMIMKFSGLYDIIPWGKKNKVVVGEEKLKYKHVLEVFKITFLDFHDFLNDEFSKNKIDKTSEGLPRHNYNIVNKFHLLINGLVTLKLALWNHLNEEYNVLLKEDFIFNSERKFIRHHKTYGLSNILDHLKLDRNKENAYDFWEKISHTKWRKENEIGHYYLILKLFSDLLIMIDLYSEQIEINQRTYGQVVKELIITLNLNSEESVNLVYKIVLSFDYNRLPVAFSFRQSYLNEESNFDSYKGKFTFYDYDYFKDIVLSVLISITGSHEDYMNNRREKLSTIIDEMPLGENRYYFGEW